VSRSAHPRLSARVALGWLLLGIIVFVGASYRAYLARLNTEVGIPGIPGWYGYILQNAARLGEGEPLGFSTYAPGQSVAAYLLFRVFPADAAVLRVAFGMIDAAAIAFLFLLARECFGWGAGLAASLLYALWPEGASASVNILHEHSPQPLFLFAGLWLLVGWFRRPRWGRLLLSGVLLGLPAMFRTDGLVVTLAAPVILLAIRGKSRSDRRAALGAAALLFGCTLIPSLPFDCVRYLDTGHFVHISAGDVGSSFFFRLGGAGGLAGTRVNDTAVSAVAGSTEPFGYRWDDPRRFGLLRRQGLAAVAANPLEYLRIVAQGSLGPLLENPGSSAWLPPGAVGLSDLDKARVLGNPDWVLAVLTCVSRIQVPLKSRVFLFVGGLAGLGLACVRRNFTGCLPGAVGVLWVIGLLALIPRAIYITMPACLMFPSLGYVCARPVSLFWSRAVSAGRRHG